MARGRRAKMAPCAQMTPHRLVRISAIRYPHASLDYKVCGSGLLSAQLLRQLRRGINLVDCFPDRAAMDADRTGDFIVVEIRGSQALDVAVENQAHQLAGLV